jgi:twinkle protein
MVNVVTREDTRACVASLELPVARYSRWLVMQAAGAAKLDEPTIRATVRQLGEGMWFIDHVGVMDVERLIDIWTYARRRYDVRHFVVDSMMRLKLGVDDYTSQKNAVDKLVAFCRTYDCHVHLVAHPRKGASDAQGVDKASIKGTSEITDLAHNVIVITRKPDHSTLELLKHREHGTLGMVGLEVDPESKTVRETVIEMKEAPPHGKRRRNPREVQAEQDRVPAIGRDAAAGRDDRHEFVEELDP